MYNRYIPQPDGSYRRSHIPDTPAQKEQSCPHSCSAPQPPQPITGSAGGFLRNLLPKDFDASDLFVILLLLLMAGDCAEDKNTALLTLLIYFFQ